MGTIAEFAVVHRDARRAEVAIDAAVDELRWVERTMTRFDDGSDIGRANRFAARGSVVITAETALVVTEALRWAEATNGMYDPAAGKIVKLWDVNHRHEPPPVASLAPLAGRRLHRAVEVGVFRDDHVLRYHDRDVSLDLGAIATEFLILGLDPYPRKPDAIFQASAVGDDATHPFAALAALKKGQGRKER